MQSIKNRCEVMYWKSEIGSAVWIIDNGSGTGSSVWEDIEQTDCHRSYYRVFISGDGI